MRIAVVGSRDFPNPALVKTYIKMLPRSATIISGGARGVDTWAEEAAQRLGMDFTIYRANWQKWGKQAGFLRNKDIVDDCDHLVAFWNGQSNGTKHSIKLAFKQQKLRDLFIRNGNRQFGEVDFPLIFS